MVLGKVFIFHLLILFQMTLRSFKILVVEISNASMIDMMIWGKSGKTCKFDWLKDIKINLKFKPIISQIENYNHDAEK